MISFASLLLVSAFVPNTPIYADSVTGCRAVDGDTLRCGRERIRLRGIDAPELPGHCQRTRACAPGDPFASTASLREAIAPTMRIGRIEQDRYGRTVAVVAGPKGDLSCWQLRRRQAIYKPGWDRSRVLARICPAELGRRS